MICETFIWSSTKKYILELEEPHVFHEQAEEEVGLHVAVQD